MDDAAAAARSSQLCDVLSDECGLLFGTSFKAPSGEFDTAHDRLRALESSIDHMHVDLAEADGAAAEAGIGGALVPTALCLSGGGIRSATFCLGAVQGLAERGLLGSFHYLSTVSGGGYLGAWLTSRIEREGLDKCVERLQAGPQSAPDAPGQAPVARLRAYTNYLSPVWGLSVDLLTLVATFLRNLVLHWSVTVPLLLALLWLPRLQVALQSTKAPPWAIPWTFGMAMVLVFIAVAYVAADLPGAAIERNGQSGRSPSNHFVLLCMLPLFAAALLLSWSAYWAGERGLARPVLSGWAMAAGGGAALHLVAAAIGGLSRPARGLARRRYTYPVRALLAAVVTGAVGGVGLFGLFWVVARLRQPVALRPGETPALWDAAMQSQHLFALFGVPALLLLFWLAVTVFVGLMNRLTSEEDREWWSRASAMSLFWSLGWMGLSLVVLCVPFWLLQTPGLESNKALVGTGTGLLGAAISAWGFWSQRGPVVRERVETFANRLGVRLLDLAALAFVVLLAAVISLATSWALDRSGLAWGQESRANTAQRLQDEQRQGRQAHERRRAEARLKAEVRLKAEGDPMKTAAAMCKAVDAPCVEAGTMVDAKLPPAAVFALVLAGSPLGWQAGLALLFAAVGGLAMLAVGVNTFSLHSMYGNRLVRAYLGATRPRRRPHWFTGFDPMDNLPMAAVTVSGKRLFPVVNVALNLAQPAGGRLEWQQRKAASFFVTPQWSGSPALGFVKTADYGRPPQGQSFKRESEASRQDEDAAIVHPLGGITLGRAMAISGAAASPNMGYHTSTLVAFAMSFFNVRLGWWMPNPLPRFKDQWRKEEPRYGLGNVLAEATAGTTADRSFVYLSDGGHFENLGLYEMVRRRCRRIVLIDATADPTFAYADLENSLRKIRIDLGAEVHFDHGLPNAASVRETRRHFAIGRVTYRGTELTGTLVYIKPAVSDAVPLDVRRYAASQKRPGAAFPHDPTSHQNFDEAQFESYRVLGRHSVVDAFDGDPADPWNLLPPEHKPAPASGSDGPAAAAADNKSSSGGALNALLTAGLVGSLAVTGTVALKDNEVVLKNPQVELREGATVALSASAVGGGGGGAGNSIVDNSSTSVLVDALSRIDGHLNQGGNVETTALRADMREIRNQLDALQRRNLTLELSPQMLADLHVAANALNAVAAQQAPALEAVVKALGELRAAVNRIAPRNNVSGTSEGARP